jgi:hypothetical protein
MKKQIIFSLLFLYMGVVSIFADGGFDLSYRSYPFSLKFSGDQIIFNEDRDGGETTLTRKGLFDVQYEDSIPFIHISFEDGENKKLLMLRDENICALFDEKEVFFWGAATSFNRAEGYLPPSKVTATSFLIENEKMYLSDNLTKYRYSENPWVEGVDGQGIEEKLFITNTEAIELYISIGYISYTRPYLYNMNSRPKDIRVSVEGKFSFIQQLSDTPNYQKITLPEQVTYNDLMIIEILSVYEGTRYQDTCINNLFRKTM